MNKAKVIAICGSTRPDPFQEAIIQKLGALAFYDIKLRVFNQLGDLPIHRKVVNEDPPQNVVEFCKMLREADGIIICMPEMRFGVPGSLRNALEWAVPFGVFDLKQVAVITPNSMKSKKMHSTLNQVSEMLYLHSSLFMHYVKTNTTQENINNDGNTCALLEKILYDMKHVKYHRPLASAV